MTRPTVAQAEAWRPDALRRTADAWDAAATDLQTRVDAVARAVHGTRNSWTGSAADAARGQGDRIAAAGAFASRCLIAAAVAARDGAAQMTAARDVVLAVVSAARADGFIVADDGSVAGGDTSTLLVTLSGGDRQLTADVLGARIVTALDTLGAADADAAHDITEALSQAHAPPVDTFAAGGSPVPLADVVAGWPAISQDRIAAQITAMTPEQRQRLVDEFPKQVGNTDGLPWDMRVAANRTNIAQAIVDERRANGPGSQQRVAFYQGLLAEIDDPARTGRRVDRQILAFDPARGSLIELNGDLAAAKSLAVLVPGMNTTIEDSAANTKTARRFVSATRGEVATITYLGGQFPAGPNVAAGLVEAADPRYALDMAPRLVAFSEDVDRTVDSVGRDIPVTYIGHSYGGSIMGTAEVFGLTADRTLYLAAAGAGVGVDDPSDWHNRNPDVLRFSMTAPGDLIGVVQGSPTSPHGADPDTMPGVIHLATGDYDDGRPMAGPAAHGDVINAPSDSWRNILAVITGDSSTLHKAG
ncbi:alpha/beta hydrolase [Mycolicibacterium moriokaense]|nr:alpha/beta hydrolase [Mycolicibacterium moriokaense]